MGGATFMAEAQAASPVLRTEREQEAIKIADAVLAWMVKHSLLDADNEYGVADVVARLEDLAPDAPQAAQPVVKATPDWRDDPSADERWCAGLDYGQTQLCNVLGVDPASINWDAATETLDGDVQSVIGKILAARFGDDWPALPHPAPDERAMEVLLEEAKDFSERMTSQPWACELIAKLAAALSAREAANG